jgi:hypothetical protein
VQSILDDAGNARLKVTKPELDLIAKIRPKLIFAANHLNMRDEAEQALKLLDAIAASQDSASNGGDDGEADATQTDSPQAEAGPVLPGDQGRTGPVEIGDGLSQPLLPGMQDDDGPPS